MDRTCCVWFSGSLLTIAELLFFELLLWVLISLHRTICFLFVCFLIFICFFSLEWWKVIAVSPALVMSRSCHSGWTLASGFSPGEVLALSQQAEWWWWQCHRGLVTWLVLYRYKKCRSIPGSQTSIWVRKGMAGRARRVGLPRQWQLVAPPLLFLLCITAKHSDMGHCQNVAHLSPTSFVSTLWDR